MVIFHSYVKLPEGNEQWPRWMFRKNEQLIAGPFFWLRDLHLSDVGNLSLSLFHPVSQNEVHIRKWICCNDNTALLFYNLTELYTSLHNSTSTYLNDQKSSTSTAQSTNRRRTGWTVEPLGSPIRWQAPVSARAYKLWLRSPAVTLTERIATDGSPRRVDLRTSKNHTGWWYSYHLWKIRLRQLKIMTFPMNMESLSIFHGSSHHQPDIYRYSNRFQKIMGNDVNIWLVDIDILQDILTKHIYRYSNLIPDITTPPRIHHSATGVVHVTVHPSIPNSLPKGDGPSLAKITASKGMPIP